MACKEALRDGGPGELAISLQNLSLVLSRRANSEAAIRHYSDLLPRREQACGPNSTDLLPLLNALGNHRSDTGDEAGALAAFARAQAIAALSAARGQPGLEAQSLGGLAVLHARADRFEEAGAHAVRAASAWERRFAAEPARLAVVLGRLGELLAGAGATESGRRLCERALAVWDRCPGPERALRTLAAERAAKLHGRSVAPLPDLVPLGIAADPVTGHPWPAGFGPPSLEDVQAAHRKADASLRAGDRPSAARSAIRAHGLAHDHLRWATRALTERQALELEAVTASLRNQLLELAAGGLEPDLQLEILTALVTSRGAILDEMALRRQVIREANSRRLPALQEHYAETTRRYASALVRYADRSAELQRAASEREEAEAALAGYSTVFRRPVVQPSATEILAALPAESAIFSYARYTRAIRGAGEVSVPTSARPAGAAAAPRLPPAPAARDTDGYVVFAMRTGDRCPFVKALGSAAEIDGLVGEWFAAATTGADSSPGVAETRCRAAGARLRERIWDPLPARLRTAPRVFVVPDAALHQVSFGALPDGETAYLLEAATVIHYLSAERDLMAARLAPAQGGGLLALGAPAFDADASRQGATDANAKDADTVFRGAAPSCAEFFALQFEALPGSLREVDVVERLYRERSRHPEAVTEHSRGGAKRDVLRLTGGDANEASLKRLAPGRRVLHLATHGFFLSGSCVNSTPGARGVGRVVGEDASAHVAGTAGATALRLAGLALAGANRRADVRPDREDGILTAEEIAALDLSSVEWAVLSGCDTGMGEVRTGEGIFGLRRAFEVAGARTLILSLWSVEDDGAREWMERLYAARFGAGLDTATAMRRASLETLRARRAQGQDTHPFHWAGFVATGDWR